MPYGQDNVLLLHTGCWSDRSELDLLNGDQYRASYGL